MQTEQLSCSGNELQSLVLHKQLHLKIKDNKTNVLMLLEQEKMLTHTHTQYLHTHILTGTTVTYACM